MSELRALLRRLERRGMGATEGGIDRPPLAFGLPAIDAALGGGLPLGCLHEVASAATEDDAAATGFCAALLGRLAAEGGPVLWIGEGLYAPGCLAFGLDPDRVVLVDARRSVDRLWAMEEGLRCTALAAVLCEPAGRVDLTASRRLQLAAGAGGATGILLHRRPPAGAVGAASDRPPFSRRQAGSAAVTRWRIAAAPSAAAGAGPAARLPGRPRWRVELLRCRGGRTGDWLVEWRDETSDFALAPISCDGPAAAAGRLRSGAV